MLKPNIEKLRYQFENFMAKGGISIFISLFVLFILCFVVTLLIRGVLLLIFPENDMIGSAFEHLWAVFLMMTDPGNMGLDMEDSGYVRISAIVAGMLGVIIFSMLIAFITTQVETMLDELKKGHSKVMEENQTLILGWNDRIMDVIRELIIANESKEDACIVVLAEMEKEDMDDEIKSYITDPKTTRIITRSGNTSSITKLLRVSAEKAKSAIILGSSSESDDEEEKRVSDAKVIKTILALIGCQGKREGMGGKMGNERKEGKGGKKEEREGEDGTVRMEGKEGKRGKKEENRINIVAELFFRSNRDLITTFESDLITSVDSWNILGKILVQTSRTTGLAEVYNEILSFHGNELYFYPAPAVGKRFYDLVYHFYDGVPMGIRRRDGTLRLRPDREAILEEGDELLIMAEDDSTIRYSQTPLVQPRDHPYSFRKLETNVEKELVLGWHSITPIIIREYAEYLPDGSVIDIMINGPGPSIVKKIELLGKEHGNLQINIIDRNPMTIKGLSSVHPYSYDNIIILSQNERKISAERIDSETLFILLLLRKILRDLDLKERKTKLITQVLNSENQELITQTNVDDFLISNKMISMIFAQVSEEAGMKKVYDNIFAESGSEIYLKPADLYFTTLPMEVNFADISWAAAKRNEVCIGFRLSRHSNDPSQNFGIRLNQKKDVVIELQPEDSLVVLAEDEY